MNFEKRFALQIGFEWAKLVGRIICVNRDCGSCANIAVEVFARLTSCGGLPLPKKGFNICCYPGGINMYECALFIVEIGGHGLRQCLRQFGIVFTLVVLTLRLTFSIFIGKYFYG
jgi:hypothetical protein